MVRAQQRSTVRQFVSLPVAKQDSALRFQLSASLQIIQVGIERDLPQDYHHFHVGERGKFAIEKCSAISNFFRQRFVLRRSAPDSRRNIGIDKLKPVFSAYGGWLGGKSGLVQNGIHKVAGAIAGKRAACAV